MKIALKNNSLYKSIAFRLAAHLALATVVLLAGATLALSQALPENQERFRVLVTERAPVGADIDKARAGVEGLGMRCVWVENRAFPGLAAPADYFYCLVQTSAPRAKQWQVALVPRARKVAEVRATFGVLGN